MRAPRRLGGSGRALTHTDLQCPLDFSYQEGCEISIKFCWIKDFDRTGIKVKVEAGTDLILVPPFPVSVKVVLGGGLDLIFTPEFSVSGEVSVEFGIYIDFFIAKCGVSIKGSLSGGFDGYDAARQMIGYIEGGLGVNMGCEIFGIQFGPELYGNVKMKFGNLGGSTEITMTGFQSLATSPFQ